MTLYKAGDAYSASDFARDARESGFRNVKVTRRKDGYYYVTGSRKKKSNPGMRTPKLGQWITARRVRVVKKNGRKVLEVQR